MSLSMLLDILLLSIFFVLIFFFFNYFFFFFFFFSSRRRHTRSLCDWSSDVCSSDLVPATAAAAARPVGPHAARRRLVAPVGRPGRRTARADPGHRGTARPDHPDHARRGRLGRRSEERRVGKEGRARWWPDQQKEKRA